MKLSTTSLSPWYLTSCRADLTAPIWGTKLIYSNFFPYQTVTNTDDETSMAIIHEALKTIKFCIWNPSIDCWSDLSGNLAEGKIKKNGLKMIPCGPCLLLAFFFLPPLLPVKDGERIKFYKISLKMWLRQQQQQDRKDKMQPSYIISSSDICPPVESAATVTDTNWSILFVKVASREGEIYSKGFSCSYNGRRKMVWQWR